jgi:hypothetical protein
MEVDHSLDLKDVLKQVVKRPTTAVVAPRGITARSPTKSTTDKDLMNKSLHTDIKEQRPVKLDWNRIITIKTY